MISDCPQIYVSRSRSRRLPELLHGCETRVWGDRPELTKVPPGTHKRTEQEYGTPIIADWGIHLTGVERRPGNGTFLAYPVNADTH